MKHTQSGFTLIEMVSVIAIITLLICGILKGQDLINTAKVRKLAGDFTNIPMYIYTYQDRYRAVPGDDANVITHLPGATLATTPTGYVGSGRIDGNWNSTTPTDESYLFWQHIRLMNLVSGSIDPAASDYIPTNAVGGIIGIQSSTSDHSTTPILDTTGNPISGMYIVCSTNISGKYAKQLSDELKRTIATSSVLVGLATAQGTPMAALAVSAIDDSTPYTVCVGV